MANKYGEIRWKWLAEKGYNVLADKHQYAYCQSLFAPTDVVQAVWVDAKAGTGKTTLAVMAGVYEVEKCTYDKIIYFRNAVAVRDTGFLPGTDKDKDAPYMTPFIEAMDNAQPGLYEVWAKIDEKTKQPKVKTLSSSYQRGVTLKNAFVIIDEAQNFDLEELQTILTRITDSCKTVVIGSTRQRDNKKQRLYAGLTPFEVYIEHFKGTATAVHKLETNYRGWFSNHADDVMDTVKRLQEAQ